MEQFQKRMALGLFLIAVGIIFLLRNLDIIDLPQYFYSWQMLLIGLGLFNFVTGNKTAGFILVAIGGLFLVPDYWRVDFADLWPVILIIIGLSFFLKNRAARNGADNRGDFDVLDEMAFFGGGERLITSQNFKGGKLTTIFGGHVIDLRRCATAPGMQHIEVFSLFGGTHFKVPEGWMVKSEVTPILGGFSDKRMQVTTPGGSSLIIKGTVMFGGVEVSN